MQLYAGSGVESSTFLIGIKRDQLSRKQTTSKKRLEAFLNNQWPSRMLKKCQLALPVETKARHHVSAYARNRYPAEFDVQLPVTGRARTGKPSVTADSADGR
jgi:hypothetical protein